MSRELTRDNKISWTSTIWNALQEFDDEFSDERWDEICTAMAWITEEIGLPSGADAKED